MVSIRLMMVMLLSIAAHAYAADLFEQRARNAYLFAVIVVNDSPITKVEELINAGANVNAKLGNGDTPLHAACYAGNIDGAQMLLQYGANMQEKNNNGKTPKELALMVGRKDIADLLEDYENIPDVKEPDCD